MGPPGAGGQRGSGGRSPAPVKGSQGIMVAPGHEVVYGRNPAKEALRGNRRVFRLWLAPEGAPRLQEELRAIAAAAGRPLPPLSLTPADMLEQLAGSADHQGVAGEIEAFTYRDPAVVLAERDLVLALDRVQDPHNLGAIIRTAEAAGAAVVIPRHRAVAVTPAVVKASAGASEHVDIAQARNLSDFLGEAKRAGFWVYGTAAGARQTYEAPDYRGRTVFVLGSEGEGLGRRVEEACDQLIAIPLLGRVNSLNVSVSAGIVLYEAVRQRRAAAAEVGTEP
jgi:23S rRNA (guanosine2251-2'-O)-methyltransferase